MAAIDTVDERRRELGEFLRSRRARVAPEVLGIAEGGRRRTPGLRREEVASDAGVGLTWYTWLEQGRAINASAQVLSAVARTLRLDRYERAHLFALAAVPDPDLPAQAEEVSPAVRALLAQLDPLPAHVSSARYDVLAWNRAWAAVMGDLSALPCERRNTLLLLFREPSWRRMLLDRERDLAHLVAQFRANMASHVGEPAWTSLVAELEASEEFRELWARHDVGGPATKRKRYLHPAGGLIELESTSMWLADQPGARLVVGVPVDEAMRETLDRLLLEDPWVPWCKEVRGTVAAD